MNVSLFSVAIDRPVLMMIDCFLRFAQKQSGAKYVFDFPQPPVPSSLYVVLWSAHS